jgi:DNA-directed RNA polymerase subunit K/omega
MLHKINKTMGDKTPKIDIEALIAKTGGSFQLTVLMQKRIKQLKTGSSKLVDTQSKNLLEIIAQEIMEDKIKLEREEIVIKEEPSFLDTMDSAFLESETTES